MDMSQEKAAGSKKNKWLLGLGIGCGALVIIVIVVFVGGYFFFIKDIDLGFKDSVRNVKELTVRYGRVEDYGRHRPDPAGADGEARGFPQSARHGGPDPRTRGLVRAVERRLRKSLAAIKRGLGVVPLVAEYFVTRSRALLDAGMGMGEYSYLYIIAYACWLKKPLEDGPGVR